MLGMGQRIGKKGGEDCRMNQDLGRLLFLAVDLVKLTASLSQFEMEFY